jgi:cation diffusion facilitator CzcD-associated flavoprotein CzcO
VGIIRVAVIGGGPSGLITLKYLVTAHKFFEVGAIEARLFESEGSIGGTFKHRSYEDAEVRQVRTKSKILEDVNNNLLARFFQTTGNLF